MPWYSVVTGLKRSGQERMQYGGQYPGCVLEVGSAVQGPCGCTGCKCVQYKGRCDCIEKARAMEQASSAGVYEGE
jgi:hypothetical protein